MADNKIFAKIILSIFISLSCTFAQDNQKNQFFDGPFCFYRNDSIIVKYYNYGNVESFGLRERNTTIFNGFLQDSLVKYIIPDQFVAPASAYHNVEKIFVVSDMHGQHEIFRQLLLSNDIINENNEWIWGDGNLVVLGDVFDRGDNVNKALWLIYGLEQQAQEYGGMVHFLLGNHEVMVLQNDLRYVDKKYFAISDSLNI